MCDFFLFVVCRLLVTHADKTENPAKFDEVAIFFFSSDSQYRYVYVYV